MAERRRTDAEIPKSKRPPGTTPEARENQLVALAVERAEQQLRDGTASAQVITHYLKLGSTREKLEQQRLENENALLKAKVEQLGSEANIEALYKQALSAMTNYQGRDAEEPLDDPDV